MALSGLKYAFAGYGGFSVSQGFSPILINQIQNLLYTDVTGTVQVLIPARYMNERLGFVYNTDGTMNHSTYTTTPTGGNAFIKNGVTIDGFVINAPVFGNLISTPDKVRSVGNFVTLYQDFSTYVNGIFGYSAGFSSLFTNQALNANNGVFDENAFINLIHGSSTNVGPSALPYTGILNGSLQINGIAGMLDYVCSSNLFLNRTPGTTPSDGFVPGDIFFFGDGISVTLNVGISNINANTALNLYLNRAGYQHISSLNAATNTNLLTGPTNITVEIENPNLAGVTKLSDVNLNNIQEKVQVPLVIILI